MIKRLAIVTACLICASVAWGQQKEPKLAVELLPAVQSIQPGQPFDVALRFKLEDGWHIYWSNSGDSGMPPKVAWGLPDGFEVGDFRYPSPERYTGAGGIVTNVLKDDPILVTTLTPPADLRGAVELKAQLQILVCKKACFMLKRAVNHKIKVQAATPAPANQAVFADAARRQPVPPDRAKFGKITAAASVDRVRPQDKFELGVVIEVQPKFHIQSNKPLTPGLVATDVFVDTAEGIFVEQPTFPKHKVRAGPGGMKLAEFDGRVMIRMAVEADGELPAGPLNLRGIARYQACNEKGQCFPPQNVAWSLSVPTAAAGSKVTPTHRDLFGSQHGDAAVPTDTPGESETAPNVVTDAVPTEGDPVLDAEQAAGQLSDPPQETDIAVAGGGSAGRLLWYMLLASLGGLILNVMPCVLPVISLKLMSFVQQSGEDRGRVFKLGLAFSGGIVLSFVALAAAVAVLKSQGENVGWGFQLSSAPFVVVLASLIFLFGLSLFGVFEVHLPGKVSSKLGEAEAREGLFGTFLKGVLATILGTPCVGPFLGSTLGWALSQTGGVIFAVFTAMGVGMALPYVILAAFPTWMRYLPKPGNWMIRFKQFMGFVLMATVGWFLIILGDLVGPRGLGWTLVFFCFLAFGAWLIGTISFTMPRGRQLGLWGAALASIACGWVFAFHSKTSRLHKEFVFTSDWKTKVIFCPFALCELEGMWDDVDPENDPIPWKAWARGIGPSLADLGYTVYIDYTASWCASCQTNKKLVLETAEIRRLMKEFNIVPIKADFTQQPDDMLAEMRRFGRQAVPYNVVFPAHDSSAHIDLPEILTRQLVSNALENAGASDSGLLAATP